MYNFKKTALILFLLNTIPVTTMAAPNAGSILRQYEQQLPKPSSALPESESKKVSLPQADYLIKRK